jgi:glutamate racemase
MSSIQPGPIGLFDSGLGGLTVLRELQRVLPNQSFAYLGDNARFPYGTKSTETIIRYARECAGFLRTQEIGLLVIACNTASAAALPLLEKELSIPVIGTVGPAVREALDKTEKGVIGILGTNATVASKVYDDAIHAVNPSIKVVPQACPLFVPLVEAGMFEGEITDKVVELYLAPLRDQHVDTVILGCTHYPLLINPIKKFLGPEVTVVECSRAIADDVARLITSAAPARTSMFEGTRYFVTDEASRFNQLAGAFLGACDVQATKVDIA